MAHVAFLAQQPRKEQRSEMRVFQRAHCRNCAPHDSLAGLHCSASVAPCSIDVWAAQHVQEPVAVGADRGRQERCQHDVRRNRALAGVDCEEPVITDGGDSEVVESGTVAAAAAAAQTLDQRLRKGAAPLHVGREPQMRDRAHAVSLVEPEERGELQNITLRLAVDDRKLEVEENGLVQLRVPEFCSARAARLAAANLSSSSTRPPAIDTLQENKKLCWLQRRMRMQGS